MRLKVDISMQMQESVRGGAAELTSEYRQDVERVTRGLIKSYSVTDRKVSPGSGQICVSLDATIPSYRASEQLKRLKLAVVPLTVHPRLSRDPTARKFADDVSSSVEAHLTASRKFAMLDRRFGAETQQELNAIVGGATPIEETVKLGLSAGADYVVLASLRDFSSNSAEGRSPLGRAIVRISVPVAIDVRVIDIATRQIKYAQAYVHQGRLPTGIGLNEYAQDIGNEIGEAISTAIYPIAVAASSASAVTFNQGGDTVQIGRVYRLVVLGKNLVDTHTNESLGSEEVDVGLAEVVSVNDRTAQARIVSGDVSKVRGQMLARIVPERPVDPMALQPPSGRPMTGSAPGNLEPARLGRDEW